MERTGSGHEAEISAASGEGYRFNSPLDKEQIKMQRQAIWDMLKHLGSHMLSQGINLTQVCTAVARKGRVMLH